MKAHSLKHHVIDLLFPLALFFCFALSSFVVLILSSDIYSSQTESADENYSTCIPLSYISEKIRQNDSNGQIAICSVDGHSCLSLRVNSADADYTVYIYEYEGYLKELAIHDGVEISLDSGRTVMETEGLTMKEKGNGLFSFSAKDQNGKEITLLISARSL